MALRWNHENLAVLSSLRMRPLVEESAIAGYYPRVLRKDKPPENNSAPSRVQGRAWRGWPARARSPPLERPRIQHTSSQ